MTLFNRTSTGSQIRTKLTEIIDSLIIDDNPEVLDDDQPNLLLDQDKRDDAMDQLIKMINFYREDL